MSASTGWPNSGTTIITISGGEPLLHPELDLLIARIRKHGILAGMITNGYLLTADRIQKLNRAGLEHLQISIDNVMPDDVSKKSLKVLDKKLQLLAEHADFHVNINSVVGGGIRRSARCAGGRQARAGVGLHFDRRHHSRWRGAVAAAARRPSAKYTWRCAAWKRRSYAQVNYFQDNIANGRENNWRCRAGSRYLYICEDGLVHYCSQQRGYPAKPLAEYTVADCAANSHGQIVRAALHGGVRAPDLVHRFLARAADHPVAGDGGAGPRFAGPDSINRQFRRQKRTPRP